MAIHAPLTTTAGVTTTWAVLAVLATGAAAVAIAVTRAATVQSAWSRFGGLDEGPGRVRDKGPLPLNPVV